MSQVVDIILVGHLVAEDKPGKFIGWFTYGIYKHASGYFKFDDGSLLGFQSNSEKGCHFFDVSEYEGKDIVKFVPTHPMIRPEMNAVYERCRELDGRGYDYMGLYGFVRRAKREHPDKYFCSEAWANALRYGNLHVQHLPDYYISPVLFFASPSLRKMEA